MSTSSSTSPRPPSSPPASLSSPTTTTTNAHSVPLHHIHPTLPSAETQRHVTEARAAVVASLENMVDRELEPRAAVLHSNAQALDKQERDVLAATEGLRREREKLGREADGAARRLKEVGNVQNWAEVLEREFLVLEETVRMANEDAERSERGSSCSCSCSECGDDGRGTDVEDDAGTDGPERKGEGRAVGGGKEEETVDHKMDMMTLETDGSVVTAWSDASRSLNEPESSTGTGMAKGSETASISTSS